MNKISLEYGFQAFGKDNNLDVAKGSLEFDIAAVLGRKVTWCLPDF